MRAGLIQRGPQNPRRQFHHRHLNAPLDQGVGGLDADHAAAYDQRPVLALPVQETGKPGSVLLTCEGEYPFEIEAGNRGHDGLPTGGDQQSFIVDRSARAGQHTMLTWLDRGDRIIGDDGHLMARVEIRRAIGRARGPRGGAAAEPAPREGGMRQAIARAQLAKPSGYLD